jgi:hypothetical protein
MKAKKIAKFAITVIGSLLSLALLIIAVAFIRQAYTDNRINDDYATVLNDPIYSSSVSVGGFHFIEQKISCGYAVIEMLAAWQGKTITEQTLYEMNDETISTALGSGFLDELSKQFPDWVVTRNKNQTNSEMLTTIYESLSAGMPVPFEFAALRDVDGEKTWTLHFAVVTAMDLGNDAITIQNPYGYEETYSVSEFLSATRYDSYKNMELFIKFGFAFGLFNKNTSYAIKLG